ncbi:MAG: PAS domain S-box protein [Desulfobacterales bacterium]
MSEDIMKQLRSEEVLIGSDRFAYKVLNASLNGIYIHDVKLGQNVFINSQYTSITGYTLGDLMRLDGTQFFELFHPDDQQRVAEHIDKVIRGSDDVVEVEYRFKTRDGRWIWCLSRDSEFAHNQDGSVSQIIGTFLDITERKQAEQSLKISERRYRNLFQNHHAVMLLIDPLTGDIINANPAACDYYGYTLDEITGLKISDINILSSGQVHSEMQSAKSKHCRQFFFKHRLADGQIREVEVFSGPVFVEDRELLYSIVHDITESKRAERALKESEQLYRTTGETIPYGVWVTDASGFCTYVSPSFLEMVGMTMDQIQQFGWLHLLPPEDVEPTKNHWLHCVQTGEKFEHEHRFKSMDGSYRNVLAIGRPVRDGEGNIIKWAGLNLDITDLKQTEDELRRLSHFPAENPNPVLRCTQTGVLLYANASARDWLATFGRQTNGALPDPVHTSVIKARGRNHTIETDITDPLGRTFSIFAVQPPGEDYINLYGIDLTDRKRAEEALIRSNRELEQFAYVASHDLQEPLRAIVGFLQLLQSRCGNQIDEKGRHYIERSVKAGHRMQTLIRELLTLSRVNTKGATFVATDINGLVKDVLDNLQSIIQEKNADITCAKLPNLTVDAAQIQSLFQNLIINAVRYNQSPKPCINIGCRERDHSCHFFVKDNGIGISPQFHQRIFMVFQRLHTDREFPGTGLGLALCKKIVERHGGRLWVESQPLEGSTFHFTLPRSK